MLEIINDILFWACLYVLLWNGYFLLVNRGIPNIKTAPAIRNAMIARLRADMDAYQGEAPYTIIDLGSGNGDFCRYIARALPAARVIGLEISWLAHKRALVMKRLFGPENVTYVRTDFQEYDLGRAQAVVLFLCGTLMKPVREKLERSLSDNTLVLSNKFKVGGDWVPLEVVDVKTLLPHQKTFYVYRRTLLG